jgi:hypothetical protein
MSLYETMLYSDSDSPIVVILQDVDPRLRFVIVATLERHRSQIDVTKRDSVVTHQHIKLLSIFLSQKIFPI